MPKLTICTIIAVRNEYHYLKILLPFLAKQNIDVVLIDNDSTDESRQLFDQYMGAPIIDVVRLPFKGYFSLTEQLDVKSKLVDHLSHDWVVHQDADEILENRNAGLNLRHTIEIADSLGYNCINFEEFVFLPEIGRDYSGLNYYDTMSRYYFFEPSKLRLQRAYKVSANLDNRSAGGHRLVGNLRCDPEVHTLRHYISLSQKRTFKKYLHRSFDPIDVAKRWHKKRMLMTVQNLDHAPALPFMETISNPRECLNRQNPKQAHFWLWSEPAFQRPLQTWRLIHTALETAQ